MTFRLNARRVLASDGAGCAAAAGALIAQEAGAQLRLPGGDSADGLGDEALLCAAPGVADELTGALVRAGAGAV